VSYTQEVDSVLLVHVIRSNRNDINSGISIGHFEWQGEPLSVTLINFTGYEKNGINILEWITASEKDNIGFDIERSNNGTDWETIHFEPTQAMNNNSSSTLKYSYSDKNPSYNQTYYRLKQIDENGNNSVSQTISLWNKSFTQLVNINPNPAQNEINISGLKGNNIIKIFSVNGKLMHTSWTEANSKNIDISLLPTGVYYLMVIDDKNIQHINKLIKN
jgi:hypothetical protein